MGEPDSPVPTRSGRTRGHGEVKCPVTHAGHPLQSPGLDRCARFPFAGDAGDGSQCVRASRLQGMVLCCSSQSRLVFIFVPLFSF